MALPMKPITKTLAIFLLLYFLIGLSVWFFSPALTRKFANDFLLEHGLSTSDDTSVRLNLFNSRLTIKNCAFINSQGEPLKVDALSLRYRFWPLIHKDVIIEDISIDGAYFDIVQGEDDLRIVGIWLNKLSANSETEDSAEETEDDTETTDESENTGAAFDVHLETLSLKDIVINVSLNENQHRTTIDSFSLSNFTLTESAISGQLAGFLTLADGNIKFDTAFNIGDERSQFDAEFVSDQIHLNEFAYMLPEAAQLKDALFGLSFSTSTTIKANQQQLHADYFQVSLHDADNSDALPLIELGKIDIPSIRFSDDAIDIDEISIENPKIRVNINSQESETHASTQTETDTNVEPENTDAAEELTANTNTEAAAPNENSTQIRLGKFTLSKPAKIYFNDSNPAAPYSTAININTLDLNNIDIGNSDAVTTFLIQGSDDEYFKFNSSGDAKVFAEKISFNIETKLYEFALPPVNAYTNKFLGFGIERGHLNSEIKLKAIENQLDGDVALKLVGTKFSNTDEVDSMSAVNQGAMPLNIALGFLKDGDGNIDLKVPLKGDVTSPEFGLQHIIGLVIRKAAMDQAKNYLINTFVPYASVVKVAMVAGEQALKVRFEDLVFETAQTSISENQYDYLNQLATLLKDKKDLRIHACAFATTGEATTREAQIALAEARAKAFKTYLVEQAFINSERILLCEAKIDIREDALPRVELGE